MKARSETQASYNAAAAIDEESILSQAREILARRLAQSSDLFSSPHDVREYLIHHFAELGHEEFGCLFLDGQNRLVAVESLFRGTVTQTSVYPREVVKAALHHNAVSVILFHNHPSGALEPSNADKVLTQNLKGALALVDVKILDHLIVARTARPTSFAELGLL